MVSCRTENFRHLQCVCARRCCGCKLGPGLPNVLPNHVGKPEHAQRLGTQVGPVRQRLVLCHVVSPQHQLELVLVRGAGQAALEAAALHQQDLHLQLVVRVVLDLQPAVQVDPLQGRRVNIHHKPNAGRDAAEKCQFVTAGSVTAPT